MDNESYSTWINVDLDAIVNNISLLAAETSTPVMAVVKANAYGHGLIPVANAALNGGALWLGVARVEEALKLRGEKILSSILVMGYTPPGSLRDVIEGNISIAIWSIEQLQYVSEQANKLNMQAKVHLKVDSGMSRLGVQLTEGLRFAEQISGDKNIEFEGIFTHYARADEIDQSSPLTQERDFGNLLDQINAAGIEPKYVHAANSAASLFLPESRFTLIRPGISIYGLHPSNERMLTKGFRPALTWKAILSQVKMLPAGRGVSYGHEYVTQKEERIGTIPIGYADGFRRVTGNQVLVGGKKVPIIGRVCMDQVCVQLDDVAGAQAGDEVVIIGSQGGESITAEEIAMRWGTINYEVVCGLADRIPRIYLQTSQ